MLKSAPWRCSVVHAPPHIRMRHAPISMGWDGVREEWGGTGSGRGGAGRGQGGVGGGTGSGKGGVVRGPKSLQCS